MPATSGDIVAIEGDYLHRVLWRMTEGWRGKMAFDCVVYYGGIHMIDLMRWLTGQEVTQVIGMGNDFQTPADSGYRYDDVILNLLQFDARGYWPHHVESRGDAPAPFMRSRSMVRARPS